MGGKNLLKYDASCPSNPIIAPTMVISHTTVNSGDTTNDTSIDLAVLVKVTANFNEWY